ncbi:MAG: potassium transporter TrkG [Nitrososphaeraceae archaeon]
MTSDPLERSVISYIHGQFVMMDENSNVADAVKRMNKKNAETILVTNKEGKLSGIITDSDILDKVVMTGKDSDQIFVKNIMSYPVITISAKATVKDALELMKINAIKRIPVIDNKRILGIITQESLANVIRTSVLEKTFRPYRALVREHSKPIIGNLGFVLQFAGILIIVPAFISTFMGEVTSATGIFFCCTCLLATGFGLNAYGERTPLNLRQASILVIISFLILSLFGSIPYIYLNPFWNGIDPLLLFVNSFFESVSGFTTTGLSTLSDPEELPPSFVFYRAYTLWVGGLSFVYLFMALFYPDKKLASMKNILGGGGILRFKQLLKTITVIFTVYTIALVLAIYYFDVGELDIIDSISLVFATITGGGFVPVSTFIIVDNVEQLVILMIGMILSALPFAFHYGIFSREIKARQLTSPILAYFAFMTMSIVLFAILAEPPPATNQQQWWITSVFHVISASTTTGFQLVNLESISVEAKIILVIVMMIGGMAYSTAGGIKFDRLILVLRTLLKGNMFFHIRKGKRSLPQPISATSPPHKPATLLGANNNLINKIPDSKGSHISNDKIDRNDIKRNTVSTTTKTSILTTTPNNKTMRDTIFVIILFPAVSLGTAVAISYLDGSNFFDTFFESVSAVTNTGLTSGITSSDLGVSSKIILSVNMIIGRFEIIAILYIFLNRFRSRTS